MGESGREHSPLAGPGPAARARSPQARVPRLLCAARGAPSEARREGATRMRAPAGSARPHAHTPSQQPRPRTGILAAAGSHGAPGRSPSARRAGASPSSAPSAIWARASLSLSSAPVWGLLPRTPAQRAPLPLSLPLAVQSSGARAQPMCAAASLRPGAQWPRPRRSCAPWKLHVAPASSPAPPRRAPQSLEAALSARPALPSPAPGAGVQGSPRPPAPGFSEGWGAPAPTPALRQ